MWPMDPFTQLVLRFGRAIDRFEQFVIRWLFFFGDHFVGLLFLGVDGLCWLGRKMLGYCQPECEVDGFYRVDPGEEPGITLWKCRKCGRIHERWGDDAGR